jgi:hypothetical protein
LSALTNEKRRRRSAKVIYDMLVARIRSEEDVLIEQAKQIGSLYDGPGKDSLKEQFESRKRTMKTLQHSLDWLVDQIISDRRHC